VMGPRCSLNQVFWPASLESPICYGLAVEMNYQFIVMLGITISTFPGCRCVYVFDISDSEISMQCLVVNKQWGSGDLSQSF
jgi:hypothetical protein